MDELSRYFDILEVRRGASLEEVKRAYRDLAQVWHPDRYGHNPRLRAKAEEKLKDINEAYQRLSAYFRRSGGYTPPTPKSSPPPASNTSTAYTGRTESRENKPPPTSSPPPPQPPPPSAANETNAPPSSFRPADSNAGCIVTAFIVIGLIILAAASRQSNGTQYPPVQPSYQTPTPTPTPPPLSPPQPQLTTSVEQTELSRMKAQIEDRVARKDAEFARLQIWYLQGVPAQDETSYRASLDRAQQEEQAIETLILTYNAKKKELDAKNLSK